MMWFHAAIETKELVAWRDDSQALKPMLARTADAAVDKPVFRTGGRIVFLLLDKALAR